MVCNDITTDLVLRINSGVTLLEVLTLLFMALPS